MDYSQDVCKMFPAAGDLRFLVLNFGRRADQTSKVQMLKTKTSHVYLSKINNTQTVQMSTFENRKNRKPYLGAELARRRKLKQNKTDK